MSDIVDDELLSEFLIESLENLDRLDRDFVDLEQAPHSREILASIFRTVHTIKGTSGFLGYHTLEAVTHVGENLLGKLRDGHLLVDADITNALLAMVDAVREMLGVIESSHGASDGAGDYSALVDVLNRLLSGGSADPVVEAAAPLPPEVTELTPQRVLRVGELLLELGLATAEAVLEGLNAQEEGDGRRLGEILVSRGLLHADHLIEALLEQERRRVRREAKLRAVAEQSGVHLPALAPAPAATAPVTPAPAAPPQPAPGEAEAQNDHDEAQLAAVGAAVAAVAATAGPRPVGPAPQGPHLAPGAAAPGHEAGRGLAESAIRVDVSLLDGLIDLVGELVLARNQLVQVAGTRAGKGDLLASTSQRMNVLTTELQERVLKTRMQPIGSVWGKLPRIVRDLAVQLGKQVRVDMDGQDTELDRTIIEAIKDPLTHLVRNTVDHGIEVPDRRVAAGKPAEGVLSLRAYHESGQVVIEIADDGAGIDPVKVKAKAVEKGVITADQAESMADRDAVGLIFHPGFSTAEKVTNVSGRGVGMDVVKTNIEKIGGSLDVQSEVGNGTTVTLRIPLTLAIVPALVVSAGDSRYAIPQANLVELVRLKGTSAIEYVQGAPVFRLRGHLLPVLFLRRVLGLPERRREVGVSRDSLVVLHAEGRQFGLVVDRVNNAEEIVVKPLGDYLKGVPYFTGCTIMGDGTVALILDIVGLAQKARISANGRSLAAARTAAATAEAHGATVGLLVCAVAGQRVALPLGKVARLEHLDPARIERSGSQEVVQYRDGLLPILRLGGFFGAWSADDGAKLRVVVSSEDGGHSVGFVVDKILDSVQADPTDLAVAGRGSRPGVLGSTVLGGVLTDLLDVDALVGTIDPSLFTSEPLEAVSA